MTAYFSAEEFSERVAAAAAVAERAHADDIHQNLCACSSWPDACVSKYTVPTVSTVYDEALIRAYLALAADSLSETGAS
jgi:hypothetical protein